ncbi:MAG: hypothetical protein PHU63_03380 [Candidatus ainarchaeum sp.]|nr:hypothetical protein [Candidatus ainarchaeum sp.]
MDLAKEIRSLIDRKEYLAAGKLADQELSKNNKNHYFWYLRGIISLKRKNYPYSLECFENAIQLKKEYEYFLAKGITYFEMFEFEEAILEFENALSLKKDAEVYFYLSLCHMFIGTAESKEYMETAYLKNKKKTKELIRLFYNDVLRKSWELDDKQKKELRNLIESLS